MKELTARYRDQLIKSVQECIRFKSVKDMATSAPLAPFGQGIADCLNWTLELGRELGFRTKNIDGYAGYIEIGEGPLLGILGHLDVVPEGDGWSVDPYGGVIVDNKIYGRGALDDKGPTLAALFAMKAVYDAGIPLKRTIRLILGTDEESGWQDMEYYKRCEEVPQEGFSPDAQFPVINAEKGSLHLEFSKAYDHLPHLVKISGGIRANVVPDLCTVVLQGIAQEIVEQVLKNWPEYSPDRIAVSSSAGEGDDSIVLTIRGISAHASTPELGRNAVVDALKLLQNLPLTAEELALLNWLTAYPGCGFNGEGFGIEYSDEPSGKLTTNIGVFELSAERLRLVVDIRYPVSNKKEDVLSKITPIADRHGFTMTILSDHDPHYVPADHHVVKSLLDAYAGVSGLKPYAIGIGGGTYAKLLPQGVAFGPAIPGEPEPIHCPDEYITIDNLMLALEIYTQAIINLIK